MNLSSPFDTITPTLDGPVLRILARTTLPMTAPDVHRALGRASYNGVARVLTRLVLQGVVTQSVAGVTRLYLANRDHLAWPAIETLSQIHRTLEARLRSNLLTWSIQPVSALLFGSAARRDGDSQSDIDLLLVTADVEAQLGLADSTTWDDQKLQLAVDIRRWTGNSASILEVSVAEMAKMVDRAEPIVAELKRDAITLIGVNAHEMLIRPA